VKINNKKFLEELDTDGKAMLAWVLEK